MNSFIGILVAVFVSLVLLVCIGYILASLYLWFTKGHVCSANAREVATEIEKEEVEHGACTEVYDRKVKVKRCVECGKKWSRPMKRPPGYKEKRTKREWHSDE